MYQKPIKKMKGILFFIFSCFLIMGCSQENPENQGEAAVTLEDKNKAAIQAVIEIEFTGPNEEYMRLLKNVLNKSRELHENEEDVKKYTSDPLEGTPELVEYRKFLEKTYAPYFMDYAYDAFELFAFSYQYSFVNEQDKSYQMKVSDIEVIQSDNPNAPKKYNFTALVEYKNKSEEITQYEISGSAICSEEGKIGSIGFGDNHKLMQKVREDSL